MATILRGNSRKLSVEFTDKVTGLLADPTVIKLYVKITADSGAVTSTTYTYDGITAPISRTSLGKFYADIVLGTAGHWDYRWEGTGALAAAEESGIDVEQGEFS